MEIMLTSFDKKMFSYSLHAVSNHGPFHYEWNALPLSYTGIPGISTTIAPSGNRTQGKCLEGIYVTTTPLALLITCQSLSHKKKYLLAGTCRRSEQRMSVTRWMTAGMQDPNKESKTRDTNDHWHCEKAEASVTKNQIRIRMHRG